MPEAKWYRGWEVWRPDHNSKSWTAFHPTESRGMIAPTWRQLKPMLDAEPPVGGE